MDKSNSCAQMGINGAEERQAHDLYCTNPKALVGLLENETFDHNIWECCNGLSHLSNMLIEKGYNVRKSDIINYTGDTEVLDFLSFNGKWDGDILTNPPYLNAEAFVYKALDSVADGHKVAMFMKVNFLATQKRYRLFTEYPPKTVYVLSKRYNCCKNGEFDKYNNGAVDFAWFVWEKGFNGTTQLKWIEK